MNGYRWITTIVAIMIGLLFATMMLTNRADSMAARLQASRRRHQRSR